MRKKLLALIMVIVCLALSACGSATPTRETADGTVNIFSTAMKNFDFKAMSECTDGDTYKESMFEEMNETAVAMIDLFKSNLKDLKWEIKETKVDGDNASVKVNYSYKDIGEIISASYADLITKMLTTSMSGGNLDEETTLKMYKEVLEAKKKSMKGSDASLEMTFTLSKKDGKWSIVDAGNDISVLLTGNAMAAMDKIGS